MPRVRGGRRCLGQGSALDGSDRTRQIVGIVTFDTGRESGVGSATRRGKAGSPVRHERGARTGPLDPPGRRGGRAPCCGGPDPVRVDSALAGSVCRADGPAGAYTFAIREGIVGRLQIAALAGLMLLGILLYMVRQRLDRRRSRVRGKRGGSDARCRPLSPPRVVRGVDRSSPWAALPHVRVRLRARGVGPWLRSAKRIFVVVNDRRRTLADVLAEPQLGDAAGARRDRDLDALALVITRRI